jgi:Heterokaryon incompatibility protein (HET)
MQLYRGQNPLCSMLEIEEGSVNTCPRYWSSQSFSLTYSDLKPLSSAAVELGRSTGSAACISLAQGWLRDCELHHRRCRPPESPKPILPTRLIYVGGSISSIELRLHETSSNETGIRYLALSHCWGGAVTCMLTLDNYDHMLRHIRGEDLLRNFQDAVFFTRQLRFAYLWIDSLCIIQDSQKEWQRQAQMSSVYAKAFCTISSCGSSSSAGGCFHDQKPLPYFP